MLSVSEGSISPVSCLECKPNPCANAGACKTLPVWERLQIVIDDFLRGVTLESVLTDGVAENAADGEKGQAAEKKCDCGCESAENEENAKNGGACYDSRKK